jgi:subtilase family serine protease
MTVHREVVGRLAQSVIDLNGPGRYVHWGFVQISVANLVVIALMIVVFVAAILVPFPKRRGDD